MTRDLSETAEPQTSAVDQSDETPSHHSSILSLRISIAELITRADELALPFVAIYLDNAMALCGEELTRLGER